MANHNKFKQHNKQVGLLFGFGNTKLCDLSKTKTHVTMVTRPSNQIEHKTNLKPYFPALGIRHLYCSICFLLSLCHCIVGVGLVKLAGFGFDFRQSLKSLYNDVLICQENKRIKYYVLRLTRLTHISKTSAIYGHIFTTQYALLFSCSSMAYFSFASSLGFSKS